MEISTDHRLQVREKQCYLYCSIYDQHHERREWQRRGAVAGASPARRRVLPRAHRDSPHQRAFVDNVQHKKMLPFDLQSLIFSIFIFN